MNHLDASPVSPWHAGERQLQQSAGVAERMEVIGAKVIRDHLPEQHRAFYELLPYLVVGTVDEQGLPWATLLEGSPGFVYSPDPYRLRIDGLPAESDPAAAGLKKGAAVGLLGIDLNTRRRNRMNGVVGTAGADGFAVDVVHTFGNCPKYIQLRAVDPGASAPHAAEGRVQRGHSLTEADRAAIRQADTFFVASYVELEGDAAKRSVDVSHRGGNTGFVRVDGDVLTIPDFTGNSFFNTLGNVQLNPVAGLLFVDFASGDVLQLAGRAEVILGGAEVATFEGAERLWRVTVEQVVRREAALALRWQFEGFSPYSLALGPWRT
ncbi:MULTISPECIES: pyridoxamine 5'-phosphate oxidase family protein [unclassified Pseudomonas]|uniref:pyridoxamine 5'-phosphate oxidase family protein n=1 Tax=unclassified Pseudomonas TaxID=196821 RepID=UPI0015A19E6A|nr:MULTISPECIES: pyridoxamine 5'-phosphate oxidase family protein [unclassified Pseudomonas]NWC96981.1 pyridoxamine 5'-phosphate oxidase family protein [Pseudomonas sp. IPO3779]NWD15666.1 pyridoxamine 5'-phosphate oxidase family protein [Pseudomonas sp. IPO3778]